MSERKAKAAIILVSLSLLIYGLACIYSPISWSPDSSKIAALHLGKEGDEARFEIWITDVESGESELLVSSKTGLSAPVWSPDGEWIAYLRLVEEGGPEANLYIENLTDRSRRRLASVRALEQEDSDAFVRLSMLLPSWSPDRGRIVLGCYEDDKPFIGVIDAETGQIKNILEEAYWPAWSPDGKWIVGLSPAGDEPSKIIIVSPDGKEKKVLVDLSEEENRNLAGCYSVWTPDSENVLYMSAVKENEKKYTEICMVDLRGKKEVVKIEAEIAPWSPAISPDGKGLAFVRAKQAEESEEQEEKILELCLMNLETGEEKILSQSEELLAMPSFSPNGRFLAYRFGGMGEDEELKGAGNSLIKILDLETEEEKVIAVNSYETALLVSHYFVMGQELVEQGKEAEGRKYLEKAEKVARGYLDEYVDFESLEAILMVRVAYLKELGKFEDAIPKFKLLLALYEYRNIRDRDFFWIKMDMAECYEALEKKSEAALIYEQIASEIPEDTEDEVLKELRQKARAKLQELKSKQP